MICDFDITMVCSVICDFNITMVCSVICDFNITMVYDLILYVQSIIFSYIGTGHPRLNLY